MLKVRIQPFQYLMPVDNLEAVYDPTIISQVLALPTHTLKHNHLADTSDATCSPAYSMKHF
jgi:hypothetical protein